jgi:hypothetical protein
MAGGGKKFNVWVAYSDIFSNLSIFLFISAFGMFAAMGLADNKHGFQVTMGGLCQAHSIEEIAAMTDPVLKRAGSGNTVSIASAFSGIHSKIDPKEYPACGHLFGIEAAEKKPRALNLDVGDGFCLPIWRSVTRKVMESYNGHITIEGTVDETRSASCKNDPDFKAIQKHAKHADYSITNSRGRDIHYSLSFDTYISCGITDGNGIIRAAKKPNSEICQVIVNCSKDKGDAYYSDCRPVNELTDTFVWAEDSCLAKIAEKSAEYIYDRCQSVPARPGFDGGTVQKPLSHESNPGASSLVPDNNNFYENLASIWKAHVSHGGVLVRKSNGTWPLPPNSVIVKVEFNPILSDQYDQSVPPTASTKSQAGNEPSQ